MEKSVRKIMYLVTGSDDAVERLLSQRVPLTAHDCYKASVTHFRTHCFNWHSPTVSVAGSRGPPGLPFVCTPEAQLVLSTGRPSDALACGRFHPG